MPKTRGIQPNSARTPPPPSRAAAGLLLLAPSLSPRAPRRERKGRRQRNLPYVRLPPPRPAVERDAAVLRAARPRPAPALLATSRRRPCRGAGKNCRVTTASAAAAAAAESSSASSGISTGAAADEEDAPESSADGDGGAAGESLRSHMAGLPCFGTTTLVCVCVCVCLWWSTLPSLPPSSARSPSCLALQLG